VFKGQRGMTAGCQVLLLRLLDDMNADGYVSLPRTRLAAELSIAPARVSERIKLARALGFLDLAEAPRPTRTAVYQATIPDVDGVQNPYPLEVRKPVSVTGTESVPLPHEIHAQERYACTPPISKRPPNLHAVGDSPTEAYEEGDYWGSADARL
jgi:hypothetical protein